MLEKIILKNFRCYKKYEVNFERFNIIVGKNNCGKSTIIDAIRLVAIVRRYATRISSYRLAASHHDELGWDGFVVDKDDISFITSNISHNYSQNESEIYSKFSDNTEIIVRFPVNDIPIVYYFYNKLNISNKVFLGKIFTDSIGVVPHVGNFDNVEKIRESEKYVRTIITSHLTPRNFRNIWYYFPEGFDEFNAIIKKTIPGYNLMKPVANDWENRITMNFQEKGVEREIFWAGHGFQVWLQLMTHLIKLGIKDTIVLDEPDIYLHSDLQKKIVNICRERSNQIILTTHAVDIIEQVEPEDILLIDKSEKTSKRLANINEVQTCIKEMGSFQNLKLSHFYRGNTCLFIEGNDFQYIKKWATALRMQTIYQEEGFTYLELDGSGNWERLKHLNWFFTNALNEKIKSYVILDSDYRTIDNINQIKEELQSKGVTVHIWKRNEIENYLINFKALYRLFCEKFELKKISGDLLLTQEQFESKLNTIMETYHDDILDQINAENVKYYKKIHSSKTDEYTMAKETRKVFNENWKDINYRISIIPGKDFLHDMNDWLLKEYKMSITPSYIAHNLKPDEIDSEVRDTLLEFIDLVKS